MANLGVTPLPFTLTNDFQIQRREQKITSNNSNMLDLQLKQLYQYQRFSIQERLMLQSRIKTKQEEIILKKRHNKIVKSIDEYKWFNRRLKGDAEVLPPNKFPYF